MYLRPTHTQIIFKIELFYDFVQVRTHKMISDSETIYFLRPDIFDKPNIFKSD